MNQPSILSRRQWLRRSGAGFGTVGMLGAMQASGILGANAIAGDNRPAGGLHHAAKAKRVIFLFMNGAPSHVDTFDPKPELLRREGEAPPDDISGRKRAGGMMPSPFKFARHGESGMEMSELFPHLSRHADDLCVVRSMHTDVPNHEPGLLLMQSGHQQPTRPSLGSWLSYGLGNENENLPSFVAISPGLPVVGPQLWSNAFLPGQHQGMEVDTNQTAIDQLIANIHNPNLTRETQRQSLDLLGRLNEIHQQKRSGNHSLETHIRSMELAFQMQSVASEAFDLNLESATTREPTATRSMAEAVYWAGDCSNAAFGWSRYSMLTREISSHGTHTATITRDTSGCVRTAIEPPRPC